MTISDSVRTAAETSLPALKGIRWGTTAIIALIALCAALAAFWWLFWRPAEAVRKEGVAKVEQIGGEATARIAVEAIPMIVKTERQKVEIRVITQEGQANVRSAPDAATPIAGVSAAMRATVCVLHDKERAAGAAGSLPVDADCDGAAGSDAGNASPPD